MEIIEKHLDTVIVIQLKNMRIIEDFHGDI